MAEARTNGYEHVAQQFHAHVDRSSAVMCVKVAEAVRLVSSDSEVRATFYGLADTRVPRATPPPGTDWDRIREVVDTALFRDDAKRHIRFAALSTTPDGLKAYGPCTLICATPHISDRASAFERNSCQFFINRGGIALTRTVDIPAGYRSVWEERGKLAVAKLAGRLRADMTDDDFPAVLLTAGPTTTDDDFVEVHIFGPMSIGTFQEARLHDDGGTSIEPAILMDLRKNLKSADLLKDADLPC